MTTGRIAVVFILVVALLGGALLYYQQVYAYYDRVSPDGFALQSDDSPVDTEATDIEAIDGSSSPIRFRACFDTPLTPGVEAEPYPDASPLNAPRWFDCFDAGALTAALEEGRASAFLIERNVAFGADRVAAITEGGRGYVWHQLNDCADPTMAGVLGPEICPPPED